VEASSSYKEGRDWREMGGEKGEANEERGWKEKGDVET